jgi:hypothetical protein
VAVVAADILAVAVRILAVAHASAAGCGISAAARALTEGCGILAAAPASTAEARVSIPEARAFHHSVRVNLK